MTSVTWLWRIVRGRHKYSAEQIANLAGEIPGMAGFSPEESRRLRGGEA